MRAIARNTLVEFWGKHPEARVALERWHQLVRAAEWTSMEAVQKAAPKFKVLNRERVRFEVAGGNYRLVAAFDFRRQVVFVKFIGTHAEYDRMDALTISQFEGRPPMEIRPIRSDKDHRAALAEIDACWGAPEGTDEGDRLDVLLALVDIYETKRWPIAIGQRCDPIHVLNYSIEALGHSQAELAALLGSRSRASEILARRRALTVEMIHKISEAWKIPADLLVRPYAINRGA
jgi:HTH-type transcriptional regulator/antitoxin HigA